MDIFTFAQRQTHGNGRRLQRGHSKEENKMIIKAKVKSLIHPKLDNIIRQYDLELSSLMEGISSAAFYMTVNSAEKDLQSEYQLRADLRMCKDVEEIVDDFENSETL
jgi:hypothetical protein